MWYNRFKEGRVNVNEDAQPGRPSTSTTDENFEAVKEMILDNRRITTREVANNVSTSFGTCQAIFKEVLGMKQAAAKIVPKLLNFEQNQCRMDTVQKMLTTFNDNPALLEKAIRNDKSWVYGYDIETKAKVNFRLRLRRQKKNSTGALGDTKKRVA